MADFETSFVEEKKDEEVAVNSNADSMSVGESLQHQKKEDGVVIINNNSNAEMSSSSDSGLQLLKATIDKVISRGYVSKTTLTPIEVMSRLSAAVCGDDGPQLYIKRDDLLPLAGGGSKTRKLDYLVQDAINEGADTLVTCGAIQSNHCRLTAAAAAREGLECHVVLEERVKGTYDPKASGNNYMFTLLGARKVFAPLGCVEFVQKELVARLQGKGKTVYVIPFGGSNELGDLGYARCAAEIIQQSAELKKQKVTIADSNDHGQLYWDAIVTCSGSGGTHTGLVTGLRAAGYQTPVLGISVRSDAETQARRIHSQCNAMIKKYFAHVEYFAKNGFYAMPKEDVIVMDDHVGPGYSLYTEEMAEAIQAFARLESIVLDPVYTGKGAAGLISIARSGRFRPNQRILFIHTGGAPSLYHYQTLPAACASTVDTDRDGCDE